MNPFFCFQFGFLCLLKMKKVEGGGEQNGRGVGEICLFQVPDKDMRILMQQDRTSLVNSWLLGFHININIQILALVYPGITTDVKLTWGNRDFGLSAMETSNDRSLSDGCSWNLCSLPQSCHINLKIMRKINLFWLYKSKFYIFCFYLHIFSIVVFFLYSSCFKEPCRCVQNGRRSMFDKWCDMFIDRRTKKSNQFKPRGLLSVSQSLCSL